MFNKKVEEIYEDIKKAAPLKWTDEAVERVCDLLYSPLKEDVRERVDVMTTYDHVLRTAAIAETMADKLGVDRRAIRRAALLHDIGKICIEKEILYKQGKLDPEEDEIMKQHPLYTGEIINALWGKDCPSNEYYMMVSHHLNLRGKGYPEAPDADKTRPYRATLEENILFVADQIEAMTSADRSYREGGLSQEQVEDELEKKYNNHGIRKDVYEVALSVIQNLYKGRRDKHDNFDVERLDPDIAEKIASNDSGKIKACYKDKRTKEYVFTESGLRISVDSVEEQQKSKKEAVGFFKKFLILEDELLKESEDITANNRKEGIGLVETNKKIMVFVTDNYGTLFFEIDREKKEVSENVTYEELKTIVSQGQRIVDVTNLNSIGRADKTNNLTEEEKHIINEMKEVIKQQKDTKQIKPVKMTKHLDYRIQRRRRV